MTQQVVPESNASTNPTEAGGSTQRASFPITAALALLVACASLSLQIWDRHTRPSQATVTVDLANIVKLYQDQARSQGLQPDTSNEQRAVILQTLKNKMDALGQVIREYAQECGCNVFVRSAIAGTGGKTVDVTRDIMQRVENKAAASAVMPTQNRQASEPVLPH